MPGMTQAQFEELMRRIMAGQNNPAPASNPSSTVPNLFPSSLTGPAARLDASGSGFKPVDPNATERLAVEFDTKSYKLSDEDWARRFPKLKAGREASIESAETNLSGGEDPLIRSTLDSAGLADVGFGGDAYVQGRNFGLEDIPAKEQRDRQFFTRLLSQNPQRLFGLSGQDIAHIALANTNGQNVFNQGAYGSRMNQYVSGVQQGSQNEAALIGGLSQIAGTAIRSYASNPQLSSAGYGAAADVGRGFGSSSSSGGI